jgi:hypothetical protein
MIINIYGKSNDQKLVEQSKNFSSFKYNHKSTELNNENFGGADVKLFTRKLNEEKSIFDQNYKREEEISSFNKSVDFYTKSNQYIEDVNEKNSRTAASASKSALLTRSNLVDSPYSNPKLAKKNSKESIQRTLNMRSTNAIKKQKLKILILIAIVSITFALTWLPAHIIRIWKVAFNNSFPYNDAMYIIKVISHTLTYSNSVLNPFFYVFIGAKFRSHIYSEFNQLCCFIKKRSSGKRGITSISGSHNSRKQRSNTSKTFTSVLSINNKNNHRIVNYLASNQNDILMARNNIKLL